jgi:spore coat polysaccharide biosynthesis protein SpsF
MKNGTKTAIVVQARMGSSRLPGKILKKLGHATVLDEVLRRCRAVAGVDVVVCAIPDSPEDDVIIPIAERAKAVVVRGPSTDVLARYLLAAQAVEADIVMRVTSDCPLIDPGLCGALLTVRNATSADYAANNMPPSFPHGLDCEVFTMQALKRADRSAVEEYDREHVTPWLRRDDSISRAVYYDPGKENVEQRWTLDFPDDYAFVSRLFDRLPPPPAIPSWHEVLKCVALTPGLAEINAMHRVRRL